MHPSALSAEHITVTTDTVPPYTYSAVIVTHEDGRSRTVAFHSYAANTTTAQLQPGEVDTGEAIGQHTFTLQFDARGPEHKMTRGNVATIMTAASLMLNAFQPNSTASSV